ncbi:hypothetical protein StrepF001_27440 [Streptomyces sp. F001]|nr:hypothetical protein StrepF001_27440 [Streptomyces sp. F001]
MTHQENVSAECLHSLHDRCDGNREIRRKGAAEWEHPLLTLRCDCACHRVEASTSRGCRSRRAG